MWTKRGKARLILIFSTNTNCENMAYRSFRSKKCSQGGDPGGEVNGSHFAEGSRISGESKESLLNNKKSVEVDGKRLWPLDVVL